MAQTEEDRAKRGAAFDAALASFSAALAAHGNAGPFVLGERLSLADVDVWPFVVRAIAVLGHYRGWKLEALAGDAYAALHRWVAAMRALESVKKTTVPDSVFIEGYASYANGTK